MSTWCICLSLFHLLLEAGIDVNFVSRSESIIHYPTVFVNPSLCTALEERNFDFERFINFRNIDRRTPFLIFCDNLMGSMTVSTVNEFIFGVWQKYVRSNSTCNGFETDNDGNNGLHLLLKPPATSSSDIVQVILETVFFPDKKSKDENGIAALNQQNINGDTPLHIALGINTYDDEIGADLAKLLLKYDCQAAKKYNKSGYLPIHIACINNNWKALAVLLQKRLYVKNDINLSTATKDENDKQTALSLSIEKNHSKCVEILCENNDIYIDDMSFYNTIQSDNLEILKSLLKVILNKDNVNDWKSFETNKNISIEFLKRLMELDSSVENKCIRFLIQLIDNGIEKKDYVYIALLLNYNISSLKLNGKRMPNMTVQVNTYNVNEHKGTNINGNDDSNIDKETGGIKDFQESKQEIIEPWIVKEKLGEGAFGQVKLGINKYNSNEKVALKFINIINIPTQFVLGEIGIIQKINHSNVIELRGFNLNVYGNGRNVLIVFEYAPHGELFDLLKYENYFSIGLTFHCFKQIVSAIVACHGMDIVHRDLKPQNILIGKNYKIKVADFGLSKTLKQNRSGSKNNKNYIVGTPGYMAPELLIKHKDNNKELENNEIDKNWREKACDIFSLSIILWQMLNGYKSRPFDQCKETDQVYKLIIIKKYNLFWNSKYHKNGIKFLEHGRNQFKNNEMIRNLFENMFDFNPNTRIKAKEIENHPWVTHTSRNKKLLSSQIYRSELQSLYYQNYAKQIKLNEKKPNKDSNISSLYSKNNNNNTMIVGYSDTQPSNESSLEISTYSEMMQQLKNKNNNENENEIKNDINTNNQISQLLRRMSNNTSNYVESQTKSMNDK